VKISEYYRGTKLTGYTIGGGDMLCRIYDKGDKIAKYGKLWFTEIWAKNGWNPGTSVTRIEFRYHLDMLRKLQTKTSWI
jgi:hypothetical protein